MDDEEEMLYREMNEEDDFYMGDRDQNGNRDKNSYRHGTKSSTPSLGGSCASRLNNFVSIKII